MSEVAGTTGEPYRVDVELGKVREFARATKARDESYFTDDRPFTPPTFLASSVFWATPRSLVLDALDVDWTRILHGEQEYVFHGPPPRAGDTMVARQRVADQYEKHGRRGGTMRFFVIVTEFRTPGGELVAESRSTVIETSRAATS